MKSCDYCGRKKKESCTIMEGKMKSCHFDGTQYEELKF
jgi:threonine dehydrogenase-like Zn-dependent dehydrogenase